MEVDMFTSTAEKKIELKGVLIFKQVLSIGINCMWGYDD